MEHITNICSCMRHQAICGSFGLRVAFRGTADVPDQGAGPEGGVARAGGGARHRLQPRKGTLYEGQHGPLTSERLQPSTRPACMYSDCLYYSRSLVDPCPFCHKRNLRSIDSLIQVRPCVWCVVLCHQRDAIIMSLVCFLMSA
jgi:hypothetical protein